MTERLKIIIAIAITAIIVGGAAYYENSILISSYTSVDFLNNPAARDIAQAKGKSFIEYYKNKSDFFANVKEGLQFKSPEQLGFQKLASVEIACPENADGVCGGEIVILSKEVIHAGKQTFYLGREGGAGWDYFGPFNDDLEKVVSESELIKSLTEIHN